MSSESEESPSYSEMLAEYLDSQKDWIGAAERPLVHLLRDLCRQIDAGGGIDAAGHLTGRYLAAVERLDKRRPRKAAPADQPEGQSSIFDFID